MQVIVVATFTFTDSTGVVDHGTARFRKTIEMPSSPVGLAGVVASIGTWSEYVEAERIHWSEPAGAFVLIGQVKTSEYVRLKLEADQDWAEVSVP